MGAMSAWPELWANDVVLLREARRYQYLVSVAQDGTISCKACGRFLPWEDPHEHFAKHQAELNAYLAKQQRDKRDSDAEGFYPNPCPGCGGQIPRSGKPGRPPLLCDKCAYPGAEEILAEFGL